MAYSYEQKAFDTTLKIAIQKNSFIFDPQKFTQPAEERILLDLFEGLFTESSSGQIIPAIAKSYHISDDRKTYTFFLRSNAKFSNGTPITASDVIFTFQRLVDPKTNSPYSYLAKNIVNANEIFEKKQHVSNLGIRKINDRTVVITLIKPEPYFLNLLATPQFSILNEAKFQTQQSDYFQPRTLVGSGAYQLMSYFPNDSIYLKKNQFYWDANQTQINNVKFIQVPDSHTAISMYQAGKVDITFDIPSSKIQKLQQVIPYNFYKTNALSTFFLDFNLQKTPFKNNENLRKAFSMAIDRELLVSNILKRGEIAAYDIIPIGILKYSAQNYEWSKQSYQDRQLQAQILYQDAGYNLENPLKISILTDNNPTNKKIIFSLASMWKNVFGPYGLQIHIEEHSALEFLKLRRLGQFDIARHGYKTNINSPVSFLEIFTSNNPQNSSHFQDIEFDNLFTQILDESNDENRLLLIEKASQLLLNKYAAIPVYYPVSSYLMNSNIEWHTSFKTFNHTYTRMLSFSPKTEI